MSKRNNRLDMVTGYTRASIRHMNHVLIVTILMLLLTMQISYADDPSTPSEQKQALQSFQLLVKDYNRFFNNKPELLNKLSVKESPTGKCYLITQFLLEDISYDIQKTTSIVTPYLGFIDIKTKTRRNDSCGNVKRKYDTPGWDNIDDALRDTTAESCYTVYGAIVNRFNFAYQNGEWVFKNVTYPNGEINGLIMAIYGTPSDWFLMPDEPSALLFNQCWLQLAKPREK